MLVVLGACGSSENGAHESTDPSSEGTGSESGDSGTAETQPGTETAEGTSPDTGTDTLDTGVDDATETGTDTGTDTGSESGTDTGTETETDTGAEIEPSLVFLDFSRPIDVTPDGRVALLENPTDVVDAYLYDTESGELTFAVTVGDPSANFSTGISDDLRISALHGVPVQAGLWTEAGGWLDLASPFPTGCGDSDVAGAWDVSQDGTVAVGLAWNGCTTEAFRWVDDGGAGTMTALEVLGQGNNGNAPTNRASIVSADGTVIAGFAQNSPVPRAAAIWNADGTGFLLDPDEIYSNEIYSISPDGTMVGGGRGYDGWYWTEAEGIVSLGKLTTSETTLKTFPNAIAADNQLIVGGFGDPWVDIQVAFVWTPEQGMRALSEVIEANGLDVPDGFQLTNVAAASYDGSVLVGYAYDAEYAAKTFVIRLDPAAYGL